MNIIQENIETYFGLHELPSDQREEILIRVGNLAYQNIVIACLEIMTEHEQDEFNKILENQGSVEEVSGYLKAKVKNFEEIAQSEVVKLKDKITL